MHATHRTECGGCRCRACKPKSWSFTGYPFCVEPGCGTHVDATGYFCCHHYHRKWGYKPCLCEICDEERKENMNTGTTSRIFPGSTLGSFLLYRDGSFQSSFDTIEDAKAAAQSGLLNSKGSVFVIFEASVKITAKPIETVETDLRPAKPEPVVAG